MLKACIDGDLLIIFNARPRFVFEADARFADVIAFLIDGKDVPVKADGGKGFKIAVIASCQENKITFCDTITAGSNGQFCSKCLAWRLKCLRRFLR